MSCETKKRGAWRHRAMTAIALVAIALPAFTQDAEETEPTPYSVKFSVTLPAENQLAFDVTIVDAVTGTIAGKHHLRTPFGQAGTATAKLDDGRELTLRMRGRSLVDAEVMLEVREEGLLLQRTVYRYDPQMYSGRAMSIRLQDAELRDVLGSIGDLAGLTFVVDPDVNLLVTRNVQDVPWDKVLDDLLNEHGLLAEFVGKNVHVCRKQ